ncbi:hypothetical protein TcasGA2_TC007777 [Tribolium castaneum]|uniref:Uncharacterized protein n=1 Tax=Tribolium castaneum TaxID=7070 RepID=D2A1U8_TRICA|nr:hypothetical protein TcasGA2_TC007777 [Tribolium castaneum]
MTRGFASPGTLNLCECGPVVAQARRRQLRHGSFWLTPGPGKRTTLHADSVEDDSVQTCLLTPNTYYNSRSKPTQTFSLETD